MATWSEAFNQFVRSDSIWPQRPFWRIHWSLSDQFEQQIAYRQTVEEIEEQWEKKWYQQIEQTREIGRWCAAEMAIACRCVQTSDASAAEASCPMVSICMPVSGCDRQCISYNYNHCPIGFTFRHTPRVIYLAHRVVISRLWADPSQPNCHRRVNWLYR